MLALARPEIGNNLMIVLIVALIVVVRLLIGYMRHKEIMKAIEKGVGLSELKPAKLKAPNAITSIALGAGFLVISLPFLVAFLEPLRRDYFSGRQLLAFGVFFAIGLAFLIRGLLLLKARPQVGSDDTKNACEKMDNTRISTSNSTQPKE